MSYDNRPYDSRLAALRDLGQSAWLDFISRDFLGSGRLTELVALGLGGMTTNPTIFDKAIEQGTSYDGQIHDLAMRGSTADAITEQLIVDDVTQACDLVASVYEDTGHDDGFVSIEVPPDVADDAHATVAAAHRLHDAVRRPNLMVKIPGTAPALPAIRQAVSDGLNINITLLFAIDDYERVADAYISGLEERVSRREPIGDIRSVASFFVSRVDSEADRRIEARLAGERDEAARAILATLKGTLGVANAKLAYQRFAEITASARWQSLAELGAHPQRLLWASTGVKDPTYSELLYVENLVGPHTVNTMPQETLQAFLDHGEVRRTVDRSVAEAHQRVAEAARLGIDLAAITGALQDKGVALFRDSFQSLLTSVERKRAELLSGPQQRMTA